MDGIKGISMMIRDYLRHNTLVADGAMGTYYAQLTGREDACSELANLENPELIRSIHSQYIEAGARLIRCNTFSANIFSLKRPRETVDQIVQAGFQLACEAAADQQVFVAADIGPIPETTGSGAEIERAAILAEYSHIVDVFLAAGAEIFVFETFSSTEYLAEVTSYIKEQAPQAFILLQFATTADGFTRKGISNAHIVSAVKAMAAVDAYGFNCGVGPTHLYNALATLELDFANDIISVLPNAGYPEIINERTVYVQNTAYFAEVMKRIQGLGTRIVGGCCGTTPAHIAALAAVLHPGQSPAVRTARSSDKITEQRSAVVSRFREKLRKQEFVVAVELDPPFDTDVQKLINNAHICREQGIDLITVADSPMAKARVDSVMLAAKIEREAGIEAMPHICCRDRNLNALKSTLLAGHIENLRHILAVTGDGIPAAAQQDVKSVFNVNSFTFMELITRMNHEVFAHDPYAIAGALNLNVSNKDAEVARMHKKLERGATFFLTQPIYSEETIAFLQNLHKPAGCRILGGIMPLVSYRNAMFLHNEIPGISIPAEHIARFAPDMERQEAEQVGIALAVEIAEKIKPYVDGFYFITPFNRIEMIIEILRRLQMIAGESFGLKD